MSHLVGDVGGYALSVIKLCNLNGVSSCIHIVSLLVVTQCLALAVVYSVQVATPSIVPMHTD